MAVGPLVYWWGGAGAAPPATPLDKFTPKFLVGNALAGDGTSVSVAGFNYILDPGDGSGLLLAFASANAEDIAIRPGTYAFPVPTVLNVPANVRVTGGGRGSTLISNVSFSMAAGSSMADFSMAAAAGSTAITSTGQGSLRDIQVVGDNIGLNLSGPFLVENVDVSISTQADSAIIVMDTFEITFLNVRVTGGSRSLDVQNGGVVNGYSCSFTGANLALNGELGSVSFTDSFFQSNGGTVLLVTDLTDSSFKNCEISGTNCVDCTPASTLDRLVFDGCKMVGATSCVSGLGAIFGGATNVRFRDCHMSSTVGIAVSTVDSVTNFSIIDTIVSSLGGTAVVLNTSASIQGSSFTSTAGSALVLNRGDCKVSNTTLTGVVSTFSLVVLSDNNTFSGISVKGGGVHLGPGVEGCSFVNSQVDVTSAAPVPLAAVTVEGRGSTFGLITYTPVATPSIHFTATSENNIVLSVVGFGATPTVVSDLGTGNEIAHSIGI